MADEAASGDDGVVEPDAVRRSRGDDDLLLELAGRVRHHAGRHRAVAGKVLREGGAAPVLEQVAELLVLALRLGALNHLSPDVLQLFVQALVLRLRVEEACHPAVGVSEGTRDTLRSDLERPHGAGGHALEVVEAAARSLAEVDGDHCQRDQQEHGDDETPLEWPRLPGGVRCNRPSSREPSAATRGCDSWARASRLTMDGK